MTSDSVLSSFIWKLLERSSTQIINLIIQIVLARLITPEEFGSLAVLIVFVNVANIFIQKGLSSSIIRKRSVDFLDYDTCFVTSIILAGILYIFIFAISPFIADVYENPVLKSALRVFSLQLFFGALYCIQNAILVREMKFRVIFIRGFISSLFSGLIGIIMAVLGYGLWALVAQTVSNQTLCCMTAWNSVEWKPKFRFSKERLKSIINFGGKILTSEFLNYFVEGIRTLAIGKIFSTKELSYYDRGQTYPSILMRGMYDTISSVLLPVYSKIQDNNNLLSRKIVNDISIITFITTPIFVGLVAIANTLIRVLLTDKWMGCIPYFVVFSLQWIPYPVQGICRTGIYAKGRSDVVLKIEIVKTTITFFLLIIALMINPLAIAVTALVTMIIVTALYMFSLGKVVGVDFFNLVIGTSKSMASSILMLVFVYPVSFLNLNNILKLTLQIFIGIAIYVMSSVALKDINFKKIVAIILNTFHNCKTRSV